MQCIYTYNSWTLGLSCAVRPLHGTPRRQQSILRKHNVTFQEACEVLFDPFFCLVDSTAEDEAREGAIGYSERSRLLYVVHVVRQEETIRITSARPATTEERKIHEHE
jgi:uncharacterized DUF497 family protein